MDWQATQTSLGRTWRMTLKCEGHVLELLGDVLPDLAQPAAAGYAPASLARSVMVSGHGFRPVDLHSTREVRRQTAVDLGRVGGCALGGCSDRKRCRRRADVDQADLGVELFTGGAEFGAHAA